jgi:peroxiredoxin
MSGVFLLLLAFYADTRVPLKEACSADEPTVAMIGESDHVVVRQALAGSEGSCYRVEVARDGKTISGYVIGNELPAVAEYVHQREQATGPMLEALARQAALAEKAAAEKAVEDKTAAQKTAANSDAPPAQVFENFAGRDQQGKVYSLAGLRGRVVLVSFWSSRGPSKHEMLDLTPLIKKYRGSGLAAIGVSTDGWKRLEDELDDLTVPWPQVGDPGGLWKRYGVDPRQGKTFVLDSEHRIVASGLTGAALEKKVREMLSR